MRVTLLRHAAIQTEYEGCYNGHIDIGLSKAGRKEAQDLSTKLNAKAFETIYCSDLRRTKETLQAFCKRNDIIYTDALREKSWGRHEGLTYDQIADMEGKAYQDFHQWLEVLDGEDHPSYIQRVKSFFFDFLPKQKHQEVLVVTHAGVIRVLFHLLEKISLEEAFSRKIPYGEFVVIDFSAYTDSEFQCA